MNKEIKYIDLFSGIGGFHQALNNFNSKCVFASEIDKYAIESYKENYNIDSSNDVTKIDEKFLKDKKIDLLCGGFPCQSFSKAGFQAGFEDETKGTLFFDIKRILKIKIKSGEPIKYILLENVANLVTHDKGNTYKVIEKHLKELGYIITETPIVASPHMIGIPQLRNRVFIMGVHKSFKDKLDYNINFSNKPKENSCYDILDKNIDDSDYQISKYEQEVLEAWNEFYTNINLKVIGFPIWLDYLKTKPKLDTPTWKKNIINKNNKLYDENKEFIDYWLKKYQPKKRFVKTHCKFEWQAGDSINNIWEGIIQFRPSGVRVKRPNNFPALVAMVQIPIVGKYKRRLTVKEVARLQSFPENFVPHKNKQQAYKQFGNSVNVEIVIRLLNELLLKN